MEPESRALIYLSCQCTTYSNTTTIMKHKLLFSLGCILLAVLLCGCEKLGMPQNANLFIEKPSGIGVFHYEIYCVKFLPPGEDKGYGSNVWDKCLGTTTIDGYEFYMFRAPRKELDIYVEATVEFVGTSGIYNGDGWSNERVRVNLKKNDWAKLISSDPRDHNGIQYRCVDGSGEVK